MTQPEELSLLEHPLDLDQLDLDTPIADAAGQAAPIAPAEIPALLRLPFEANEYDALEQAQVVPDAEDDYR